MTDSSATNANPASPQPFERLVTRLELSELLSDHGFKISPKTLAKMATLGGGPEYRRFGNRALYSPSEGLSWAQARLSQPRSNTSEAGR